MIAPPRKTELGQEELRKRTRRLSQRHRTVLLLVDGKRSRSELLTLAQQAGSAPSLFDELLAMGMVEEPSVPTVPALLVDVEAPQVLPAPQPEAAPEPQAQQTPVAEAPPAEAATADEPPVVAERVEIEIAPPVTGSAAEPPAVPSADEALAAPLPAPPEPPLVTQPVAVPVAERRVADQSVPVERRAARAKVKFAPPSDDPPPPVRPSGPVPLVSLPEPLAAELPPELAPTAPLDPEQRLLTEVRSLLVGTLLIDSPLSSSLLALRVGRAKSRDELIALVWEIEHSLARSRRPREARGRLERARDLLGLGNTLVDEDTSFGRDSQW